MVSAESKSTVCEAAARANIIKEVFTIKYLEFGHLREATSDQKADLSYTENAED